MECLCNSKYFFRAVAFFLFLCFLQPGFAQVIMQKKWERIIAVDPFPSRINETVIALDAHKNTYLLIRGTIDSLSMGCQLFKFDSSGAILWERNIEYLYGIQNAHYRSFLVDSIGNAYVGTHNWINYSPDFDAILTKFSPEGTKLWEVNYSFGIIGSKYFNNLAFDTTGRIIAVGEIMGRPIESGDNVGEVGPDDLSWFAVAIDTSDGKVLWKTICTTPGEYSPMNLRLHADRIEVLSLRYVSSKDVYLIITQIDFQGHVLEEHEKLLADNYFINSYICKNGDILLAHWHGGYAVTKLNQRGDSLWQFRPDASFCPYTERVMALIEDDAANVYTTGSICIDSTMRQLTAKLGQDGALIWQNISADTVGLEYAQGNGICLDNGKVIVAGGTRIDDCSTGTLTVFKAHGRDGGSPELQIGSDSEISSFFW